MKTSLNMTVELTVSDVQTAIAEYVQRNLEADNLSIHASDVQISIGLEYKDDPMDRGTPVCKGAKVSITKPGTL